MALTDLAVRKAAPQAKSYKLFDGEGMFLLITPSGGKCWRLKYRLLGKEKLLALGTYPEVSLAGARERKLDARRLLSDGIDPSAERKESRRRAIEAAANTFKAVAEEWHRNNSPRWKATHAENIRKRLEAYLYDDLADRPVADIKPLEVLAALRKLEKRGATHLAHRMAQYCQSIFRYAIVTQRAEYNPAADLRGALVVHKAGHYPTIPASELPTFFQSLARTHTTTLTRLAVKLLLSTFVRTGEMRAAEWAEIHWDAREWRIPAERMKMQEAHVVPLADEVLLLLRRLHEVSGNEKHMFPSQQRKRHSVMSENTINQVLDQMGYKGRLVGHGFRSLASTTLNEMGFAPDVIERQLAHRERNKVRAAYNRAEYLPQRRDMMGTWAKFLVRQAGDTWDEA